ncbi:EpsG family protein [Proteus mirabilis]|uniref:EpsG family protein n=1 Tax=Proteus mirabilis TaxID=584 RepID=UPI0025780A03|nr:EpsG family protein [Proteus mirabilis]MDM3586028.1 EpsG family protein [Proteus mirabilis]MDM3831662.1 EpsG family protein [Proteus mirabilis]MEC4045873.1 EpsG family protein [Proteus mirabilis]
MYWIISFLLFIPFFFLEEFSNINEKKIIHFLSLFLFFIITTGSYYNGVDWINYIYYYKYIGNNSIYSSLAFIYEPGFVYLNWLLANIIRITDFHIIPFISSSIFFVSIFYSLRFIKFNINLSSYLALLIIFLAPLFNDGYRQLIALAIILPYLFKIEETSIYKWVFICLISSIFHFSAILLIPFIFLLKINFITKKIILSIIIITFLIIFLINLTYILPIINPIIPSRIYNKLSIYLDMLGGNLRLGFFAIIDIVGIFLCIFIKDRFHQNKTIWNSTFIYFLCHLAFYFSPFLQRLLFYLYPILILNIFITNNNIYKILLSFIIIIMGLSSFARYINNPYYDVDFWEPKFYYTEIFSENKINIENLKKIKCNTIEKLDENFCKK